MLIAPPAIALALAVSAPAAEVAPGATPHEQASTAEPAVIEPIAAESAAAESATTDPEAPEPAGADSATAEPATIEPIRIEPGDLPGDDAIVVTAREKDPADPLAQLNAQSYEAIQAVDAAVIGPVAMGYEKGVPAPLRSGLRNFLRNLEEPVIALNYLLQLKPGRAVKSVGRFAINSTFGVAGLVDVAKRKPFHLPYTPNGFANTFACYGIGPGPYFFLPLIGPTTLRDVIGVTMDRTALPVIVGKPFNRPYYAIPANVIDSLNDRIEIDGQLAKIREESADPYTDTRELYLKQRKAEIAAICPKKGEVVDTALPPRPGKGRD
jgi:phospholipid-binding lipoprotein MlaA